MAKNKYKDPVKDKKKSESKSGNGNGFVRSLLNGSFLSNDKSPDLMPFLLFLSFLAVMLIANNYYAEKKVRQIEKMRSEITELRTIYISNKAELMYLSNQSEIARRLYDKGFVESTVPPRLLQPAEKKKFLFLRIPGRSNK